MLDLAKYRADFPMLAQKMHGKPLIYFDSAATAQKPQVVIDSMTHFYQNHYGTVHRAIYELSMQASVDYHQSRLKVQKLLNAKHAEEVIFTRGTTEAINLVAHTFGKAFIEPGDEVIISEIEHHSNIVPWQMMCQERQAKLRVIPVDDQGVLNLEAFKNLLSNRTKLVAVAHISNVLGTLHPIEEMIALAHTYHAKVLIDGAQAIPHLPIDVQKLEADFYVFSGHKVYGPTGVGVLYGKKELLELLPPYQGGGDMIEEVSFPKTTYNALPLKFEAGTPLIAEVIGLGKAIDYLQEIGLNNILEWEQSLLNYATERIQKIPNLRIIGNAPKKGAIISFIVEGFHPLDIGTLLDFQGIAIRTGHHCAQPAMRRFNVPGTARLSFGLYNTPAEVDYFMEVLPRVIGQIKKSV